MMDRITAAMIALCCLIVGGLIVAIVFFVNYENNKEQWVTTQSQQCSDKGGKLYTHGDNWGSGKTANHFYTVTACVVDGAVVEWSDFHD
jgi:hypothetical protein